MLISVVLKRFSVNCVRSTVVRRCRDVAPDVVRGFAHAFSESRIKNWLTAHVDVKLP